MKKEDLFETLGGLKDIYLERAEELDRKKEAAVMREEKNGKAQGKDNGKDNGKKFPVWAKLAAAAACLALAVLAGSKLLKQPSVILPEKDPAFAIGGIERNYKSLQLSAGEIAMEWPWAYQTLTEQYSSGVAGGICYETTGMALEEARIGGGLGVCHLTGYDIYADETHQMEAEAFSVNGVLPEHVIAVRLGGDYISFKNRDYDPPAVWGELLDEYHPQELFDLTNFSVYYGDVKEGDYSLVDDEAIWAVLQDCRQAEFVYDDFFFPHERSYVSFTVTSNVLGAYKRVFLVTEDGYIWTNLFEYQYLFFIGEEAAGNLISYAKENGGERAEEPYTNSLAGVLTEIGDGYILVDDSMLCENEGDGIAFMVPTSDVRVRRCVEFGGLKEGDIVVVYFTGEIDAASGYLVNGAYSLAKGMVQDGYVSVPE